MYYLLQGCKYQKIVQSKCLFNKLGLIPKNSISGSTSYFYVEKVVFSPKRGKMSFSGGMTRKYNFYTCSLVINSA